LDDWLRGDRDWATLWEFLERLQAEPGTAYHSALLSDPAVAEQLADLESTISTPPLEGYSTLHSRLDDVLDRLGQLVWAQAGADPTAAPAVTRPVYPHIEIREHRRRAGMRALEMQLTGGE